ncbi:holo-ACP synthase [bacterium]|nr:holo-ACP synthase [bacterium]
MNIQDFATGIDIEKISRFDKYSSDKNAPFITRIYTTKEIEYCFSYKNPAEHLAVRFCAKEAVYKALSALNIQNIQFKQIEITNNSDGVPIVKIQNKDYDNIIIKISLSHGNGNAMASVFAVKTK